MRVKLSSSTSKALWRDRVWMWRWEVWSVNFTIQSVKPSLFFITALREQAGLVLVDVNVVTHNWSKLSEDCD